MGRRALKSRHRLDRTSLLMGLLFITLLVGGFSISRVIPERADLGALGEARYLALAVLLGAVFVLRRDASPRADTRASAWTASLLLFYAYLGLSYLWTPSRAASAPFLIDIFLLAVFALLLIESSRDDPPKAARVVLRVTVIAGVVFAVAGLARFAAGADRASAFSGGPNVFARIAGAGAIAALYEWSAGGRARWAWLACVPLCLVAVILSGSRGGLLATSVALGLLLVVLFTRPKLKRLLPPVAFVLAGLAVIALIFAPVRRMLADRYIRQTLLAGQDGGRGDAAEEAWRVFLQDPVFGAGYYSSAGTGVTHPHNIFLHVLSDGGLVGFVILLVVIGMLLARWRHPTSDAQRTLFAIAALYFVSSWFSGIYYDHRFIWFYAGLFMLAPAATPVARGAPDTAGSRSTS